MTVTLYIEGGGDNRRLGAQFRAGWASLFGAAGLRDRMPRVVRGGSRHQTFQRFVTAVTNPAPGTAPLLLVDAEAPVKADHSVWQHLHVHDGWRKPVAAGEDDAYLMVQIMETWFLADRDALRGYFGPRFVENALKEWAEVEHLPKAKVLDALSKATADCPKPYTKGKHSFELLERIDPARIEAACPHAKTLLNRLRAQ